MNGFGDTTNLTDNQYPFLIRGGSATQFIKISEIYMGGLMSASALAYMLLSRDSTVSGTAASSTTSDVSLEALTAALAAPAVTTNGSATKPQRDSAAHLLNLSFNAFGGVVRWVAYPGEEIAQYGTAVSVGETSLSAFTNTTANTVIGAHMIYEPS
jgi:hypothetical protein